MGFSDINLRAYPRSRGRFWTFEDAKRVWSDPHRPGVRGDPRPIALGSRHQGVYLVPITGDYTCRHDASALHPRLIVRWAGYPPAERPRRRMTRTQMRQDALHGADGFAMVTLHGAYMLRQLRAPYEGWGGQSPGDRAEREAHHREQQDAMAALREATNTEHPAAIVHAIWYADGREAYYLEGWGNLMEQLLPWLRCRARVGASVAAVSAAGDPEGWRVDLAEREPAHAVTWRPCGDVLHRDAAGHWTTERTAGRWRRQRVPHGVVPVVDGPLRFARIDPDRAGGNAAMRQLLREAQHEYGEGAATHSVTTLRDGLQMVHNILPRPHTSVERQAAQWGHTTTLPVLWWLHPYPQASVAERVARRHRAVREAIGRGDLPALRQLAGEAGADQYLAPWLRSAATLTHPTAWRRTMAATLSDAEAEAWDRRAQVWQRLRHVCTFDTMEVPCRD